MGIELGSNFDVKTTLPLDSRLKVADSTARDAIVSGVRYEGMIVYVVSEATNFQLVGGIANGDWTKLAGSGGGGGSSLEWTIDTNGPLPDYGFFQNLFKFIYGEDQQLYAVYPVPLSYSVGDQIKMAAKVTSPDTSTATLHFKTQTTLIVAGDHLNSTTNQRTSTNAELNLTMITSDRALALECDLTDADGKINSVSVSPGDLLIIRLYRDDTVATSTVPASFLPKTSEVFVP